MSIFTKTKNMIEQVERCVYTPFGYTKEFLQEGIQKIEDIINSQEDQYQIQLNDQESKMYKRHAAEKKMMENKRVLVEKNLRRIRDFADKRLEKLYEDLEKEKLQEDKNLIEKMLTSNPLCLQSVGQIYSNNLGILLWLQESKNLEINDDIIIAANACKNKEVLEWLKKRQSNSLKMNILQHII